MKKNGNNIRNRIIKETTNEIFFTIFSRFSSEIFLFIRFTKDPTASLNKKPPSSGTMGRILNNPTRRLSQKIQYNAFTIIQKTLVGRTLRGPFTS